LGGGNRPDGHSWKAGCDGLTGGDGNIAGNGLIAGNRLGAGNGRSRGIGLAGYSGLAGRGAKAGEIGIEDGGRYENLCGRNFRRGRVGFNRRGLVFGPRCAARRGEVRKKMPFRRLRRARRDGRNG